MTIDLPIYTPGERLALFKATLKKLAKIWIMSQHKGVISKDLTEAEINSDCNIDISGGENYLCGGNRSN